jgi:hypothetical protein
MRIVLGVDDAAAVTGFALLDESMTGAEMEDLGLVPAPRVDRHFPRLLVPLRCVMREDKVPSFGRLVAGEAGLVQRPVARLCTREVSEPPASRRSVFL